MAHADILPTTLRLPEKILQVPSTNGVTVAITDWGTPATANRPVLFMCHATGLHGHCYVPLVRSIGNRFRCVAVDQRGQGDSTVPRNGNLEWNGVADDVEAALSALGLHGRNDVYGVGHSQGGFAVLEAERRKPGTFQGLFLYEPVVFRITPDVAARVASDNHMAARAEKRRATFASWEEAVANFRVKGPFAKADEDLVRSYVYWGFSEQTDGSVTLKCRPEIEAELFRNSATDLFEPAAFLKCAVTVAVSELTEQMFLQEGPALAESMPNGSLLALPGRTHFGMFEDISSMADIICHALLG